MFQLFIFKMVVVKIHSRPFFLAISQNNDTLMTICFYQLLVSLLYLIYDHDNAVTPSQNLPGLKVFFSFKQLLRIGRKEVGSREIQMAMNEIHLRTLLHILRHWTTIKHEICKQLRIQYWIFQPKKFLFIVFSTSSKFKWFKSFHQISSFFEISETLSLFLNFL